MPRTTARPSPSPPTAVPPRAAPAGTTRRTRGPVTAARLTGVLSLVAGIALWHLAAALGTVGVPGPGPVAARGAELLRDGTLATDALVSLRRVLTGWALGTAAAIPVGALMGWYPLARALLEPWVQFFRVVPPLAIIPLTIVLLGIDEPAKITVIFLAAFLSTVVSVFQGVVAVDRTLVDAARVLGARDPGIFVRVVVPATVPFLFVGARVGLGAAWSTLVAAELIAAQQGLGYRMQQAQLYYDLETIFVGIVGIGTLGLLMDRLLIAAERRATVWQERRAV
ncbi:MULTISPECIES: ABC transporter permease [Streptomyces]|uniref:ABC transporter permease n=1 Tax=Streptomyces tsukubensis (strain DSM 42081 / NBRC 108919 / NRRL 18488 / 9993) TaxID=1114943 RepID=A0A7G3UAM9_STRT9|nr:MULTISPECIES: ABC transporter permease [Streptomyces]AZK97664.1 ABC transporter permease [Streptomyces tsukubensis]MYS64379.1 ABC transporter permease subunit [Streptomyces sp. SID5473]QKM66399.1 ABC transporter permease [Streptomyces tsukubensis NRRL18488]TAI45261.1 ABC transporter permease [Streptomyces tsukubensis]